MQETGHFEEQARFASSVGNFVRTRQAYYGREFEKNSGSHPISLVVELGGRACRSFLGRVPRTVGVFLDLPDP